MINFGKFVEIDKNINSYDPKLRVKFISKDPLVNGLEFDNMYLVPHISNKNNDLSAMLTYGENSEFRQKQHESMLFHDGAIVVCPVNNSRSTNMFLLCDDDGGLEQFEELKLISAEQYKAFYDGMMNNEITLNIYEDYMKNAEEEANANKSSNFEECQICYDLLDNIHGPGPSDKCDENCNDVIKICKNNHIIHRGCVLNSCYADAVDTASQMGFPEYSNLREQKRRNKCPFCAVKLLYTCERFKTVPKENISIGGQKIIRKKMKIRTKKLKKLRSKKKLTKKLK